MNCPACNAVNPDDRDSCAECGLILREGAPAQPPPPPVPAPPPPALPVTGNVRQFKANRKTVDEARCRKCGEGFALAEDVSECANCGGPYHERCWNEAQACVSEECRQGQKPCPNCGHYVPATAAKCRHCGAYVDPASRPAIRPMDEQLRDYLAAGGISRVTLNILCAIGVFICGWLLAVAFAQMGRGRIGWAYIIPIIILLAISRAGEDTAWAGLLMLLLYAVAWIHANVLLSGVQAAARRRVEELRLVGDDIGAALEAGLLLDKALGQKQAARERLLAAANLPGGDPTLLNQAGMLLFADKQYREARELLARAQDRAQDPKLREQIGKTLQTIDKTLAKQTS